jgi:hypothetical protein
MPQTATPIADDVPAAQWWERRRLRYNLALVAAIALGYFAYVAVVSHFADVIGRPILDEDGHVVGNDIEFGGIEGLLPCCGAGLALLLANLFYFIGAGIEGFIPRVRVGTYRRWAWRAGVAFSCSLPFSIALLHLLLCLFFPNWYDRTPIRLPPPGVG